MDLVASLAGIFRTSSDMNTGEADMDVIGERTKYVFGRSVEAGGSGSPALPTAVGVEHGIRASLRHVFGSDDLAGRAVLVHGAGGVGSLGWSRAELDAALAAIGETLTQVYELADAQRISTAVAAEALAEKRLGEE